ncbi:MAG: SDR family NAD(P)-dependent oxidoreductase [bacterium]
MTTTKPLALVTGASSGIGHALAKVFAQRGYDLILCARREDKLQALASELAPQCHAHVVALDLAKRRGPEKLFAAANAIGSVDTLINNAGAAYQGRFENMPAQRITDIVHLNMRALTETCALFLPQMIAAGTGKILNVSSVVGFQAVPGMALYSASKAFVLSFTESLAEETRCSGIKVCALCPGLTDTEMVGDLGTAKIPGAQLIMSNPQDVALQGYNALHQGEVIRVPGIFNQAVIHWAHYQPRWLTRTLAGIAERVNLAERQRHTAPERQ